MSANNRWMPLYIPDYLADTAHLTTIQHGAYMLLLMHYWRNGPLPDDDEELASIAKADAKTWKAIGRTIRRFFSHIDDGLLHQKRMDHERSRWAELSDRRSRAGKAGANAKHNPGKPDDKPPGKRMANAEQTHPFASQFATVPLPLQRKNSLSLDKEEEISARETVPEFAEEAKQTTQPIVMAVVKATRTKAYPPRAPVDDIHDQIDKTGPKRSIKPAHLTPAQLAVARQRA